MTGRYATAPYPAAPVGRPRKVPIGSGHAQLPLAGRVNRATSAP